MSTVKIKTEPTATTTTTAAAVVDVKVKLEPSLSTGDIKLEQHTSEADIKSESDDDDDDTDQNQASEAPKKRQYICNHHGCSRSFNSAKYLNLHKPDHMLQVERFIFGKTYTLTRQSVDDRWACPFADCATTYKGVDNVCNHIRKTHGNTIGQQQQQQKQQPPSQVNRQYLYFQNVDDFYVNEVRCGHHSLTGAFICYECKLVPECLLTHLQQKHGYDEKSIDKSVLPESAVTTNTDPNGNQHTNNTHLAAAIRRPRQLQHQDIVQGWLCVTSDCGYCCSTKRTRNQHKYMLHQGVQFSTVPALVLRLAYTKKRTYCFLITRIDQITSSSNRVNQHKLDNSHNGLNTQDENGDDINQDATTETSNQKRQWKCDYDNCGRFFNSANQLSTHRREHKLEVVVSIQGTTFTLSRPSSDDRWPCPIAECEATCKTVAATRLHIHTVHDTYTRQKRAKTEDEDNQQQQQNIKRISPNFHYLKVDDFRVNVVRCGYHSTIGVFICHECRLVPECLLTHLQKNHGYDGKSINNEFLPESAVNAGADPNGNQHTGNPHLTAAIREPNWQRHQDIVQGWLCVTSNCGYCGCSSHSKFAHKTDKHNGEQISTVPAQLLRLLYAKAQTSCFLITRLDTVTGNVIEPTNSTTQYNNECADDDGAELVLSDYSDDEVVH